MNPARAWIALCLAGVLAASPGCICSLHPFFQDSLRTLDPRLPGVWQSDDATVIVRTNADSTGYDFVDIEESVSVNESESDVWRFDGRLARIGGTYFLDLSSKSGEGGTYYGAVHELFRLELAGDTLRLYSTTVEAEKSLLQPAAGDSVPPYEGIFVPAEGKEDPWLLMVSSSASLEELLARCAKRDDNWTEGLRPLLRLR